MRDVQSIDDLANREGIVPIRGDKPSGSMNAVYIETIAYGVQLIRKAAFGSLII